MRNFLLEPPLVDLRVSYGLHLYRWKARSRLSICDN